MPVYYINDYRTSITADSPAAAVAKDLRNAGYKARAQSDQHVVASRRVVEITQGIATVRTRGHTPTDVTIGLNKAGRRTQRPNPAVACSANKKRDKYRAAKVMHKGEWVQNGGCWDAKGVPSYVGKGESGKRRVIAKKVVRQKASRTPSRVKGVRARKRR